MARRNRGLGLGVAGASSGVGIAVGVASHLVFHPSLSKPRFHSFAPTKHLVPTGDEV
jgi:hypothetical protein